MATICSSSDTIDSPVQFLEEHGFFYLEESSIGELVNDLYATDRVRSDEVRLDYFKATLQRDAVSEMYETIFLYVYLPF